ncbi:MAG: DNA topoisomerase (ATP-hydrolyzing) subunit A [Mycoplasma sp.]
MAIGKSKKGRLTSEEIKDKLAKTVIKEHSIVKELETSFIDYAMSVIISRALPDARDGFKPVHRRVLYAAYDLGMTNDKPYKKSARLVGEVIGKYHPHGDSAVYETMVRMAQNFSLRYMLFDGHGNFGSIDGDSAAAMRYTETRLAKISNELLKNIDKDTVDFAANYDGSEFEPTVLPSIFPNLLANGTSGIAVGMATNMPPHNLNEICAAAKALANNEEITIEELSEYIKGPDFPTGAEIVGDTGIKNYFATGKGSVTIRSKYEIEEMDNGKKQIIINEIPYMVNKANLINRIVELVSDKSIEGITDLRDETSRDEIRVVIELRRDIIPEVLLNKLFKTTQLQTNFSVNNLALVNGEPKILNIKEILFEYLKHQYVILVRRYKYDLKKAEERAHILEGLVIAVNNIDETVSIIKNSKNDEEALQKLVTRFELTETQAKQILDMRLRQLTGLQIEKLKAELEQLRITIQDYKDILENKSRQTEIICNQLDDLVNKYGDERRTEILYGVSADIDDEDLIPVEDVVITMSKRGYLKRLPIDTYRTQHRGGVGVQALKVNEDDDVEKIIVTTTHTDLLFFTQVGKVYRIRAHQVPIGSRQSKGIPALNVINIEKGEEILSMLPIENYDDGFLFFVTKKGLAKRTSISEFESIRCNGKIAISLRDEDTLFAVHKSLGDNEVFIGANNGKLVRFNEDLIRNMGRTAAGVKAISLADKEFVVGSGTSLEGNLVLSVGEKGVGKLTASDSYRLTNRGAKGVTTLKVNDKTGSLASIKIVNGDEELLMITTTGKIIRMSLEQVNTISRNTSGVKLMNLENKEKIQSVAIFKTTENNDEIVEEESNPAQDDNQ